MEERQEQLLEAILEELQTFNATYTKELERAENERTIQATKDSNDAKVLAEKQQKEVEEQKKQEQEALKLSEQRFEIINEYFLSQENAHKASESHIDEIIVALGNLDPENQEITLNEISNKLNTLVESTEVSEEQLQEKEVRHFTDLALIVFLFGFIPCFLAYKGLSRLFDSAFA